MSDSTTTRPTWPAKTLAVLAVLAIIDAIVLTNTHAKLLSQPDFESFCNISAQVSCDSALASIYAKLLGVPVSIFAIVAYALMLGLALLDLKAINSGDPRAVGTGNRLFAIAGFNLLFSLYMAGAATFDLQTLCILCAGLYLIALVGVGVAFKNLPAGLGGFGSGLVDELKDSLGGFGPAFLLQTGAVVAAAALVIVFNTADPMGPARPKQPVPGEVAHDDHAGHDHAPGEDHGAPGDDASKRALQLENLKKWIATLPTVQLNSAYHQPKGTPGAPIQIVEFADFQCPACARAWELLQPIYEKHKDKVEVTFRHFPLSSECNSGMGRNLHTQACGAARAAVCAERQGAFWKYADQLFAGQRTLNDEKYREWAKGLNLDMGAFEACMNDPASIEPVKQDVTEGIRIEVSSTPTIIINNRVFRGFDIFRTELFELLLEAEGAN